LRLPPPLRFRSLPGALRVRTPIDAPGVAPAAVAPHGAGLASVALAPGVVRPPRALSGSVRLSPHEAPRRLADDRGDGPVPAVTVVGPPGADRHRFDRDEANHLTQVATSLLVVV
jgi:hypothetical protein